MKPRSASLRFSLRSISPLHEMVEAERERADATDTPLLRALDFGKRVQLRFRGIPEAPSPLLPEEGFGYVVHRLRALIDNDYDAIVLITGATGTGKSSLALQLTQALDRSFDMSLRLCYSPLEVAKAYEGIQPGQVVCFDESVRGLQSTDTFAKEQKELVKLFSVIRAKRAIVFILAPSPWQVAKQVRDTLARMWIHVERRGLARLFDAWPLVKYSPDANLRFAKNVECPTLTWSAYPNDDPFYADYLKVKDARMNELVSETISSLSGKRASKKGAEEVAPDAKLAWIRERIASPEGVSVSDIQEHFHIRRETAVGLRNAAADSLGGEAKAALEDTSASSPGVAATEGLRASPAPSAPPAPPPRRKRAAGSARAWARGQRKAAEKRTLKDAQRRHPERPRAERQRR